MKINPNPASPEVDNPKIGDKAVLAGHGSMVDKGKSYVTHMQNAPAKTGTGARARMTKDEPQGK
jgi:hypothetical protein